MIAHIHKCEDCGKELDCGCPDPDDEVLCMDCDSNRGERRQQVMLADYYGGDGPQTFRERHELEAIEKRRIG